MKKVLIIAIISAMLVPSMAFAGKLRNNVGCGIGTLLFESTGNENGGWLLQTFAISTNGILYSGFSMTTGTMGCQGEVGDVVGLEKTEVFIAENMDDFAKDIAMGHGETINTVASLLEVTDKEVFALLLQSNFSTIFPHENVKADQVLLTIVDLNI